MANSHDNPKSLYRFGKLGGIWIFLGFTLILILAGRILGAAYDASVVRNLPGEHAAWYGSLLIFTGWRSVDGLVSALRHYWSLNGCFYLLLSFFASWRDFPRLATAVMFAIVWMSTGAFLGWLGSLG